MRPRHACIALALFLPAPAFAQAAFDANVRLRQELVDDAALPRDASATTLRLRLGASVAWSDHWTARLEGEGIAAAGAHDDGTHGRRAYPVIADPEGAEWNQAWIAWKNASVQATLGRQRVVFGNQRWVGNSGWRQNEQTFDALQVEAHPSTTWAVRYVFLDRVHRVNGDDALDPLARERALSTHVADLAWTHRITQWNAYALLHEDHDVARASTATLGLRMAANPVRDGAGPLLALEYAHQRDHADNPLAFSHAYWLVEGGYTWKPATLRAGIEHLGGDGTHALQTPLATLHAFNGWADKFANATPPGGLDDYYASLSGKRNGAEWTLAWHRYRAGTIGANTIGANTVGANARAAYGSEWNASLAFPLPAGAKGLLKLADYRADGFARDTTKLWLQVEWQR